MLLSVQTEYTEYSLRCQARLCGADTLVRQKQEAQTEHCGKRDSCFPAK
jgi:hypothetical protein